MLLATTCLLNAAIGYAEVFDVSATVSGWTKNNGETNGRDTSSTNFMTGRSISNDPYRSNYFVFDLSGVSSEITSASLKLQNPVNGFYSFDNDYYGNTNCCTYYLASLTGTTASNLFPENWSYPSTGIAV
ncbi:MAG: hypothetical protein OQK69_10680 [Gammaproteobacteria bacterium]|nr:hypothetical protein [Gammaproteobacteria bacterium]